MPAVLTISKWGNSLGIRLPSMFSKELELKDGDNLVYKIENNSLILSKAISNDPKEIIASFYNMPYDQVLKNKTGIVKNDEELDWGEDIGAEIL